MKKNVDLDYRLSNMIQCWQANLETPTRRSDRRDEFWREYQKKGIDFVMKKYRTIPIKTKIMNKILKIMGGYELSNFYYADYSERRTV